MSLDIMFFFFFNDTATTEIYTLSLHDALPIFGRDRCRADRGTFPNFRVSEIGQVPRDRAASKLRSEEHTSELQSHLNLVCRLLLEKKKKFEAHCYTHSVDNSLEHCYLTFDAEV